MELARKTPAQRRGAKKLWHCSASADGEESSPGNRLQTGNGPALPARPGGASEAPGLGREADNSRARCHLQLLPCTKAPSEVDLFIPLLQVRHERPGFDVFITTPSENQRAAALLMPDPSGLKFWDQLGPVASLILLTFALVRFDVLDPPPPR